MNILVLGSSGFIGSRITADLLKQGHHVTCCVRNTELNKRLFPDTETIYFDFLQPVEPEKLKTLMQNIDVLINCVGIFYHPNREVIWQLHFHMPQMFFTAAEAVKIKKIIHISALNTERYHVDYAESKQAAENLLKRLSVNSIILKPSLVYGSLLHGSMKTLSLLACVPLAIPLPKDGEQKIQPIHVDDLSHAVVNLLEENHPEKTLTLHAVTSEPITIKYTLAMIRNWFGFADGYFISIPLFFLKTLALFGDVKPYSKINSSALKMLSQNNMTSPEEARRFQQNIHFIPKSFSEKIHSTVATRNDRWLIRILQFRPLLRLALAFMWIMSAIASVYLTPVESSYLLLTQVGVPTNWQPWMLYGASAINLLIGIGLIFNIKPKINYAIQLIIVLAYTIIISVKLPYFWNEPFGPIAKNIPILMLIMFLFFLEVS